MENQFKEKSKILNKEEIKRTLMRIAHEILEKNNVDINGIAIVGIYCRGSFLAQRIADIIKDIKGQSPEVGVLDITLYRDDLTQIAEQPVVHSTKISFDITNKIIVLVDDVLFTGRTVRCALDELIDFGRPKSIQLAVLVDRGHRELPIKADFVGKNIPTSTKEVVNVRLEEADGIDEVVLLEKENNGE